MRPTSTDKSSTPAQPAVSDESKPVAAAHGFDVGQLRIDDQHLHLITVRVEEALQVVVKCGEAATWMTIDTEPGDLSPGRLCQLPAHAMFGQDDVAVTEGLVDSDPVAALLPSVVPGRDNGRMSEVGDLGHSDEQVPIDVAAELLIEHTHLVQQGPFMQDDDAVDVVSFEQSLSVEGQCAVAMAAVPYPPPAQRPRSEPGDLGPDEGDHDLEEVGRPRVVGVRYAT